MRFPIEKVSYSFALSGFQCAKCRTPCLRVFEFARFHSPRLRESETDTNDGEREGHATIRQAADFPSAEQPDGKKENQK